MDGDSLKDRYYGSLAATYDRERVSTPLWIREQEAVQRLLGEVERGSSVIDVPVGTGRFLADYHERGLQVTGLDASTEMLAQSRDKAEALGMTATFQQGDLRALPFADRAFDLAVCIRFLNWVKGDDLAACIRELSRVSKQAVIGIRSYAPLADLDVRSARSVEHHLKQLKLRFYQARTRATFVYHEAGTVQRLFAQNGWTVRERIRIPIKAASDYFIYRLERSR